MRLLILLGASLMACGASGATEPLPVGGTHVLFIGNSLTYVNDLPGTVEFLASTVHDTVRVRSVALPDYALIDHVNGGSDAVKVLTGEKWNFVVLQQGPSAQQLGRDTLVLATQKFDPFIKASGAASAQFSAWPASNRISAFDSVLVSSQVAARAVNGLVFAAGAAWKSAWTKDASLQLYGSDGYHPSELGTYLTALVVYEGVTGHDAQLLPARAHAGGHDLATEEATVRMLQTVAHKTVLAYRNPN